MGKKELKGGELYERRTAKTNNEVLQDMTISSWCPQEAPGLYMALEHPNWAPWLEASETSLVGRASIFPAGQLVMKDSFGNYAASLSLNQINWDGVTEHLPSWDDVAGDPTDYSQTYTSDGNTLVLLSMNVASEYKGLKLPSKMIEAAQKLAKSLGVAHLIGSFRPSGYGEIKKGMPDLEFETYCMLKKSFSDKPLDHWLGSLWHMGMKMLEVDHKAMTVTVPVAEFESYKQDDWKEVKLGVWECGEVGQWKVDAASGTATYQESNVWGSLPLI